MVSILLTAGSGGHRISPVDESVLIVFSRWANQPRPRLDQVKRPLAIVSALIVVGMALAAVFLLSDPEPQTPLPKSITVSTPATPPGEVSSSSPSAAPSDDDRDDGDDGDDDDDDGMVNPPPALDDVDDRDDIDDDDDDDGDDGDDD